MIHIWAFDPGQTTGWCHISFHDGEIGAYNSGEADHFQIGNMLFDNPALKSAISKKDIYDLNFVVEKFTMNSKITQSPWSLETTGLIRYFAAIYQVPLHIQTPSQAKGLVTNEIIKKVGLWVPDQGHAMDAVRHALWFLMVKKGALKEVWES